MYIYIYIDVDMNIGTYLSMHVDVKPDAGADMCMSMKKTHFVQSEPWDPSMGAIEKTPLESHGTHNKSP